MSLAMILIELRRKSVAVAIFDVSLASQQQQQQQQLHVSPSMLLKIDCNTFYWIHLIDMPYP